MRLRMSLDQAAGLSGQDITVLMHYPPLFADGVGTPFTDILEEYAVTRVSTATCMAPASRWRFAVKGRESGIF